MSHGDASERESVDNTKEMISPVSSVDKLPPEILSNIFLRCLPEVPTKNVLPDPIRAPLLLCQISGYWRQVALSTPNLWCSISVIRSREGTPSDVSLVSCLEAWLNRSGSCPLSLYLEAGQEILWDFMDLSLPPVCVDMIIECSRRWRDLTIGIVDKTSLLVLFEVPTAPLLEHFSIAPRRDFSYPDLRHAAFLNSAPRLHSIKVSCDFDIYCFDISWSHITSLDLDLSFYTTMGMVDCMHLLSQCPNLEDLCLSVTRPRHLITYVGQPIILPNLSSLTLTMYQSHLLAMILNGVVTPHLLHFHLDIPNMEFWPQDAFLSFFQHTVFLRGLKINAKNLVEDVLVDNLRKLPSLTCLDIVASDRFDNPVITDRTIVLLTLSNSGLCLLPNLEHLSIGGAKGFSDKAFVDMIMSRRDLRYGERNADYSTDQTRVTHLKSVRTPSEGSFDLGTILFFQWLSKEGLKITMSP